MPVKKTDKEQWVRAGLALLDGARVPGSFRGRGGSDVREVPGTGRYLPEVTLGEICALVAQMSDQETLSKGSFYNHFPDGLIALYEAVIDAWQDERDKALEKSHVTVLQDPAEVLRVLRSSAEQTAVRDDAMGRWADAADAGEEGATQARYALAASNEKILGILTATLVKLGLAAGGQGKDGMAETQAKLLAADFGCGRGTMTVAPGDENGFKNLMQGLDDMAFAERERQRKARDRRLDVSSIKSDGRQTKIFVVTAQSADPAEVQAAVADLADRIEASEAAAAANAQGRRG
jgi:AcrR family transcriptional regulator